MKRKLAKPTMAPSMTSKSRASSNRAFPKPSTWVAKKKPTNPFEEISRPNAPSTHKRARGRKNAREDENPNKIPKTKNWGDCSSVGGDDSSVHFTSDEEESDHSSSDVGSVASANSCVPVGDGRWELPYDGKIYTFREIRTGERLHVKEQVLVKYGRKGPHHGLLYPATITAIHENGTFSIKYDDGETNQNTQRDVMYIVAGMK